MDMDYSKYDFKDSTELYVHLSKKGLSKDVVRSISKLKDEPQWMLDFRLRAYDIFMKKPMPTWGADLSTIDFQNIFYYAKATEKTEKSWDDVPEDVKNTFDKLGIPEAEKKFLAGVGAQYESEVVYHSLREDLQHCTKRASRTYEKILWQDHTTRCAVSYAYARYCTKLYTSLLQFCIVV